MQLTKNFHLKEFFPEDIYKRWGDKCRWFLDPKIPLIAQALRDEFGEMKINGGQYNYSGFRPIDWYSKKGKLSQHRHGRAIDCKFKNHTSKEVFMAILDNEDYWLEKGIMCLENVDYTPTWLHVDCRWNDTGKILIVNP